MRTVMIDSIIERGHFDSRMRQTLLLMVSITLGYFNIYFVHIVLKVL